MKNIFDPTTTTELIKRINNLHLETQRIWGTMSVGQMLAHCNVTYELAFEDKHPAPGFFKSILLTMFVKNVVVSEKPYGKNTPTGSQFVIKETKDFGTEKTRLINYIQKTEQLGESYFEGKKSHSFGALKVKEWNNMFYKHLDHHLTQFGV
jgi:hypothetical protein